MQLLYKMNIVFWKIALQILVKLIYKLALSSTLALFSAR